ncbi:hypothetical protein [Natrinema sp. 74]|uniref:hypothetical protein n=1 Tax=Natrinema sp. 74 TaxID=3384159 RepID=UPI0038D45401
MPADRFLTPLRRDAVLVLAVIGLLAAPLWVPTLHLSDPNVRYERAEVVTNGTEIKYATETDVPSGTPISDEIACSGAWETRPCAFERLLLENQTVPTRVQSASPGKTEPLPTDRYRYQYVHIDDTIYKPTYVANESARRGGMYRVELSLKRMAPEEVLRSVSRPVSSDDVPSAVAEVVRSGDTRTSHAIAVPETPIRIEEDGETAYYRVYEAERSDPWPRVGTLISMLTFLALLPGIWLLWRLSRRIDVTYVGGRRR